MLRFLVWSLLLFSLRLTAASAAPPLPGDHAAELKVGTWLQKGMYDQVRPAAGGLTTAIEFFATWDPLSRAVLPEHDKLQAELASKGVRFLLVSQEPAKEVRAYLKQAKLGNLAVVTDPQGALLAQYTDREQDLPFPFAVLVRSPGTDLGGEVLWTGPTFAGEGTAAAEVRLGYDRGLSDVLAEVMAGRYDVATARESERTRVEGASLCAETRGAIVGGQVERLPSLVSRLLGRTWPRGVQPLVVEALGQAAWLSLTARKPTPEQAATFLRWAQLARELNGKDDAGMLHLVARAQFENGNAQAALETERKAVALPLEGTGLSEEERWEALVRYAKAAGVTEPSAPAPKPTETAPKPAFVPPPQELTAAEAVEDIRALQQALQQHYVAYSDIEWRLTGEGSSWEAYTNRFVTRAQGRPRWRVADFLDLLQEYLSIAEDHHLFLQVRYGEKRWEDYRPMKRAVAPYFSDLRIATREGRRVVTKAPPALAQWVGAEVLDTPTVGTPNDAALGRPYLFPTLPQSREEIAYLLGALADASSPPAKITVRLGRARAAAEWVTLPLHAGRVARATKPGEPWWSLSLDTPLPVLAVRHMQDDTTGEVAATADTLRTRPAVVLDLRGNGGGNDALAVTWCARLSGWQVSPCSGAVDLAANETAPGRRWRTVVCAQPHREPDAPTFAGRLFVLSDRSVASSAEGLISTASALPGTLVLGENSGGFGTYGNLAEHFTLPHSRLTAVFGYSKFLPASRPFKEGFGMFPDYWLDTEDPVGAIAGYVKASGFRGQGSAAAQPHGK